MQQAQANYEDFRQKVNKEYADWIGTSTRVIWESQLIGLGDGVIFFGSLPPVKQSFAPRRIIV